MSAVEKSFERLLTALESLPGVRAAGKTGGKQLPAGCESDIDLFIFCDQIPEQSKREAALAPLSDAVTVDSFGGAEDVHWGLVDALHIGNQEVYLMFFSIDAFSASLESILNGRRLEREANYFYPTGRCASVLGMYAFYDPDRYLEGWQQRLAAYPEALSGALIRYHCAGMDDEEDFSRAIRRGDALFYHATLDLALDHFLQALFALNRVYFPSRKRSLEFIRSFAVKPENCEARLLRAVALGAKPETLEKSYRLWQALCRELNELSPV